MDQQTDPHRKMIVMSVSSVLKECGFDTAEKDALGTLTEMMQACKYLLRKHFLIAPANSQRNIYLLSHVYS